MIVAPILKTYSGIETEDFFVKYYLSQAPDLINDLLGGVKHAYYEMNRISEGACFAFSLKNEAI